VIEADSTQPTVTILSTDERRDLLDLARRSILAALRHDDPPRCARLTPRLIEPAAAFVSLHQGPQLRGCVGTLHAEHPLHHTVARMARSAAFEDPRFPPLLLEEVALTHIEISRLGPPVPAAVDEIEIGVHGVCIALRGRRAVFLPQVATLYGWDRDTLLTQLCRKAQLDDDAWRSPEAVLLRFEAEIFGDGG